MVAVGVAPGVSLSLLATRALPVLRRAKERRQVIIVTHKANVAALGDAELIVVMKAMNNQGEIVNRGSIVQTITREVVWDIRQGGTSLPS